MYSRNYGGIQSEGQLYNLQNELKNELLSNKEERSSTPALENPSASVSINSRMFNRLK